jgi:hypothetical protein
VTTKAKSPTFGICAYCDGWGRLSVEEVFPKFMAKKVGWSLFIDRENRRRPTIVPPKVWDVCRRCNNQLLGGLDQYASELFREYFNKPLRSPIAIDFSYDYPRLERWLLKCFFNVCRKLPGEELEVFRSNRTYILYGRQRDRLMDILVGVFQASDASTREVEGGLPETFGVMANKFGRIGFRVRWVKFFISLSQGFSVGSYFFVLLAFFPGTPEKVRKRNRRRSRPRNGLNPIGSETQ